VFSLLATLLFCQSDGGQTTESIIQRPTVQCSAQPRYPTSQRSSGISGAVALDIELNASAQIQKVKVRVSLGEDFETSSLAALQSCIFTAATVDGVSVPSSVLLAFQFVPTLAPWILEGDVVGELGEALTGANLSFGTQRTTTDDQGHFRLEFLSIPEGDEWVTVDKAGYALKGFPEVFQAGHTTKVRYGLLKRAAYETRIEGSRLLPQVPEADSTPQVSRYKLTRADIDRTPGALEDISRVVQQLPGVAADPDLLANFFVRGGSPDETIIFIDGVPQSNPFHLGGFASIINPLLVDGADFYAGAAPARFEPALSGVLDIRYVRPDVTKFKAVVDVSMLTAKARVDVPLPLSGLSLVASFRRSYFESYFAVLKAFKLFGQSVVAPDITEAFVRLMYRQKNHLTLLTFTHASDGFHFVVNPGEQVLVNFAGNLKLSNSAQIVSLRHEVDLPGDSEFTATAAYTRDENGIDVESQRSLANAALRHEVLLRADLTQAPSEQFRASGGLQYAYRTLALTGTVTDARAVAPWAQEPIVDSYRPVLPIAPALLRSVLAGYLESTVRPTRWLSFEGGGRAQFDATNSQATGSGRLAAALTLPTLTVLKGSAGIVWQPFQRPLALDPTHGNPALKPEGSWQFIAAIEQPLPFEALLRVEGWSKLQFDLVTNPDSREILENRLAKSLPSFTNEGSGVASGVDAMLLGRTRHFSYSLGLSGLSARRTNPLAQKSKTYPVQWEQQFTAGGSLTWSPNSKWVVTARSNVRLGRPYTPVSGFVSDRENERFVPELGDTSSERYPLFFELNLRGEHRFQWGPLACALYAEVLNVTNSMNVFSWVYGSGNFADGIAPGRGRFTHLPIRPFLGLRAEY
jgi:TonB family protein